MRRLQGLDFKRRGVSHLGCVEGCLEYLGLGMSWGWLCGGTGHAFVINIAEAADLAGVTAWDQRMLFDLAPNLGYRVSGFSFWKGKDTEVFAAKQWEAWQFVRQRLDAGWPCYGWELKAPYGDYWVINGYDDVGYYYSGWETGGPVPWQKLGDQDIPLLEVRSIEPCSPATEEKVVADAILEAIYHATNPKEWINSWSRSGPTAFEHWAQALERGTAKRDHHTYNAEVWLECRRAAVDFLMEVKTRLKGRHADMLDESAALYAEVCRRLEAVLALHPHRELPNWGETFGSPEASDLVREAGFQDGVGLDGLRRLLRELH